MYSMAKSSITCDACGEDNPPESEFCIKCGTKMTDNEITDNKSFDMKKALEYRNWKKSVPYTAAVCIFLLFLDIITGSGINWSYWAVVPIFLFAILAPYVSYKIS